MKTLITACLFAGSALCAHAAVQVQTYTVESDYSIFSGSSDGTLGSISYTLQQFNPSLGTLNSVAISLNLAIGGDATMSGIGPDERADININIRANYIITDGSSYYDTGLAVGNHSSDGITTDGTTQLGPYNVTNSTTLLTIDPLWVGTGMLTGFLGNGTTLRLGDIQVANRTSGTLSVEMDVLAASTITVEYDYAPVPEPGEYAAIAGAVCLWVVWLRRRH